MLLQELRLTSFKNHASRTFRFGKNISVITGANGVGKTNVLDAIHVLCMTRSYFQAVEVNNIQHEEAFYTVFGKTEVDDEQVEVACMFKRQGGKTFRWNKEDYKRLSEHIGKMPVVMIAPGDIRLINEYSDERRRFMDSLISQSEPAYLQALIRYQKALDQRNQVLKACQSSGYLDTNLLASYERVMIPAAQLIKKEREQFLEQFIPYFLEHYRLLSDGSELAGVNYESGYGEDYASDLSAAKEEDRNTGRTNRGPHKDELVFMLDERPIKKFGSQGQIKSFLIALKLAQFDYLKDRCGKKPFLLLDDIFEKLDASRTQRLLQLVAEDHFGQIFITDTHKERVLPIFDAIDKKVALFEL